MGYQLLTGVLVERFGTLNAKPNSCGGATTAGKAFGGWVYNANVELGFSQQPTSITLDIALDVQDGLYALKTADFLISKEDLNVRATALTSGESYYKITLGTRAYRPMFLVSYEINGSPDGKTLKVKFVDYSLILDKTRIAIFKRHDYKKNIPATSKGVAPTAAAIAAASFFRKFSARPQINALCPGCSMEDSSFYDVVVNKQTDGVFDAGTPPLVTQIESAAYFYNHKNKLGFDLYNTNSVTGTIDKLNGLIPVIAQSFWPESLHILDESTRLPKVVTGTAVMSELYKTYYNRTFHFPAGSAALVSSVRNSVTLTSYNDNKIDINGGTVVLGTEEFNESVCGSAAKVSYNFTELICILSKAGFNFSKKDSLDAMTFNDLNGTTSISPINKNQNYRKDYSGTLREVLGNWCADFGLDFYVLGTRIHFIELSNGPNLECDIESIVNITKPGYVPVAMPTRTKSDGTATVAPLVRRSTPTKLGHLFNSNTNYAIGNFTESADISDTYEQRIVTFRVKPRKVEEKTKEKKHHCGFLAMHPLDFLDPNMISGTDWRNIYSRDYTRPTIANVIWRAALTTANKRYWYTNRSFEVIDRCAAIGKYSKDYRDIYAGQLICQDHAATAVYAVNSPDAAKKYKHGTSQYSHTLPNATAMEGFNSFAFMPLYKIGHKTPSGQPTNDDIKLAIIEKVFKKAGQAQQQYIIDHRTFDVWLGFRNEQEAEEIISWENSVAENMYKYGVMVRGSRDFFGPALPQTFFRRIDETTGDFERNTDGSHKFFPNPLVYPRLNDPFVSDDFARQAHPSLGFDSGSLKLLKIENSSVPAFQRYRFYEDLPFRNLFKTIREYVAASISIASLPIASLDNDWGTSKEQFDADLRVINHASSGCSNFGDAKIVTGPLTVAGTSGVNGVPLEASLSPAPYAAGALPATVAPVVGSDGSDRAPDSFSISDFSPKFIDLPVSFFENVDFSGLKNAILNNPAAENLLGKLMVVQKESVIPGPPVVKAFSQAQCPRLQVMIIPRLDVNLPTLTSQGIPATELNPHLTIKFEYGRAENKVHERTLYKNLYLQTIEKQKEFVKTKCDYSLSEIVCKVGKASTPVATTKKLKVPTMEENCKDYSASHHGVKGANCQCYAPINEIISSVYNIGFPKGTVKADGFEFPARKIKITINVHPRTTAYIAASSALLKPLDSGGVGFLAADESYPAFVALPAKVAEIIYPRQSDTLSTLGVNNPVLQNKLYQGILTQRSTFQLRNSETIECHGDQWFGDSNVSKVQMINNEVEQDIEQLLDSTGGLYSPVYDMRGNAIKTIKEYHELIKGLSEPTDTGNALPARTMNLEIIGNVFDLAATNSIPSNMAVLAPYLTHERGLKSLSFSLTSEGFKTHLTFSNRAAQLPKPEALLNKIRSTF